MPSAGAPAPITIARAGKVDKLRLLQMMREGRSATYMAQVFGCTIGAVTKMRDRMKKQMESDPNLIDTEMARGSIDAMSQLSLINSTILQELRRLQVFIDREDRLFHEITRLELRLKKNPDDFVAKAELAAKQGVNYKQVMSLQDNVMKIAAEIRHQLEFQLNIAQTLYSVRMMAEFQEEVISILKEADPEICEKVIKKLKERRAMRGLLKAPN